MAATWKFRVLRQRASSRRLILEGHASPPYERPYHDPLLFYAVVGPDFLSLEVSRDFDGERLLEYVQEQLGPPQDAPRVQVGGSQLDEEGALVLLEWRFPESGRDTMIQRLGAILEQSL